MSWESISATWRTKFSEVGALWIHDGNPKRPHALLTSGNHSNGFFNASKVITYPSMLEEACADILHHHADDLPVRNEMAWVVGSAFGAITIAHTIALYYGTKTAFTEPVMTDEGKQMQLKRFDIVAGDKVLVVEDVMTTGGTTRKTIAQLEEVGADVYPAIVVLVNRSGITELDGRKIIALIDYPMPMWIPDECPLCEQDSEAIRPKGNWAALNASY